MGTLSLIKSIARNIKYQELPELIGKTVIINSIDTIADDIRRDLGLSATAQWVTKEEKSLRGAMAKYGLIDVDYLVSDETLAKAKSGIELIRKFHLVQESSKDEDDEFARELIRLGLSFLEDIAGDLAANQVYCKLFLWTEHPTGTDVEYKQGLAFPESYFPRQFIVENAALSNTSHIWMFTHFYL